MSSVPDTAPDDAPSGPGDAADAREAPPALGDLRAAVRQAADRLVHLREKARRLEDENERLRERVHALEADPATGHDGAVFLLEDDPDALRGQIDEFIEALDAHLDRA